MGIKAYYAAPVAEFLATTDVAILGELAKANQHSLEEMQRLAWMEQIGVLKRELAGQNESWLFLELQIPRMGKRADAVLLTRSVVFVLEFKVGADKHAASGAAQVEDYALDLKNFHEGSHTATIVPILISTDAVAVRDPLNFAEDYVARPIRLNAHDLGLRLHEIAASVAFPEIDREVWIAGGYRPTPTIVQAAETLYRTHSVVDLARSDAGAKNLQETTASILAAVHAARETQQKMICFVTGVPGSGKTLAGLNIATLRSEQDTSENAVFLSGNGPLVTVLREALTRDRVLRTKEQRQKAFREVSSFVQNIHHFRSEYVGNSDIPADRVVVFDEAQRAWNQREVSKFMLRKKGVANFGMSEPEFLLSAMDRHRDWCAVICLVGGGQEINTGEAGISEWFDALDRRFPDWKVYVSPRILHAEYGSPAVVEAFLASSRVTQDEHLHLAVPMRSFRAESLAQFVDAVLAGDHHRARHLAEELQERYPIVLTRSLATARSWLKQRARGSERYGLVASSGAVRLRPEGLHVKAELDPANWFLNPAADVRSSCHLEEVASEFAVQGLELDWVGVCWDGDLSYQTDFWRTQDFKGTRWFNVNDAECKRNVVNAYRVLLTRARQGMVIFVPPGSSEDITRLPDRYSGTFSFLTSCGIGSIESDPNQLLGPA